VESTRPVGTVTAVTAFVCANCARAGQKPDSGGRPRPSVPNFNWPFRVREVLVNCAGRIQPENILKAFESGTELVCIVGCDESNCHYLEGSKRCARRVDYVRETLGEIGLGEDRLLMFNLAGSSTEDMALGAGAAGSDGESLASRIASIRDSVVAALAALTPSPLYTGPTSEQDDELYQEVDTSDDDNDE
jgi:coenzyme F420-reducing hydrogenase delta subunit